MKQKLSTILQFKNGKKRPQSEGSIPVYGGNGILGFTDQSNNDNCIAIGRVGAYCGSVYYEKGPCWISDNAIAAIAKENADIAYAYYLLKAQHLNKRQIGTSQPLLTQEILNSIEVELLPYDEQVIVGRTLQRFDEAIALNTSINENLTEQARAIFQSWFIDFEPFGGTAPSEWTSSILGQIAVMKTDSWSPAKAPDLVVEHYSIPAFDEKHYPVFEIASGIKSNKYILTPESVMISKLNPDTKRIWRPLCLSDYPVCSTEFIVYEAIKDGQRDYIYSILDSMPFLNHLCSHTTGSTNSRQRATPKSTLDYPIMLPPDSVIEEFCSIVSPMYNLIASNLIENQSLAQARDDLLPRLMSGKLDVTNL